MYVTISNPSLNLIDIICEIVLWNSKRTLSSFLFNTAVSTYSWDGYVYTLLSINDPQNLRYSPDLRSVVFKVSSVYKADKIIVYFKQAYTAYAYPSQELVAITVVQKKIRDFQIIYRFNDGCYIVTHIWRKI